MFEAITQLIRRGSDGAPGPIPPLGAFVGAPRGIPRGIPRPTVLDAECECPDECLRDHENE